jgi:hypothetical protein
MVSARDGRWLAPGRVVGNASVGWGLETGLGDG